MKYLVTTGPIQATHINPSGVKVRLLELNERAILGPKAVVTEDPEKDGYTAIPPVVQPVPVPQEVPLWAFRTVATAAGLMDAINTAIDALDEPAKTAANNLWNYGNVVLRNSPTVLALVPALGLSSEQVDAFFIAASNLKI